jgi:ABC-type polysaccharide/polyol phosphate transport system ATPase subunit
VPDGRIEFQHVWKKFRRGQVHDSLRDFVPHLVRRVLRGGETDALRAREFWAVEDVSFSVRPGEALGIIGPNGAGKSTVLKLLTRILRPTHGRCGIRGRVGALIETSAGFHPDLTGGENIFLQGAIMGMTRREIAARFDDIVAFSELQEFIDTPVKRYSSGMNARLGFAIAAHMNPDVLIVDEVLAVGDYRFQRKAFDHISGMIRRGLPVAIVSHQLDRVATLCTHCLLLDRGRVVAQGPPDECISRYVMSALGTEERPAIAPPFTLTALDLQPATPLRSGDWLTVRLRGEVPASRGPYDHWGIRVRALQNAQPVFAIDVTEQEPRLCDPGPFDVVVRLQANTARGYFAIETPMWNTQERREVARGPHAVFRVEGSGFTGATNLHASVQLVSAANADELLRRMTSVRP